MFDFSSSTSTASNSDLMNSASNIGKGCYTDNEGNGSRSSSSSGTFNKFQRRSTGSSSFSSSFSTSFSTFSSSSSDMRKGRQSSGVFYVTFFTLPYIFLSILTFVFASPITFYGHILLP